MQHRIRLLSTCPEACLTYRISRARSPEGTVFGLSGEMDREHAERLESLLVEEAHRSVLLDLQEVTLVAREAALREKPELHMTR